MSTIDPHVFALQRQDRLSAERTDRRYLVSRAIVAEDVELLAALLDRAKIAHTVFEQENGTDNDWPKWYAEYLLGVR